MQFFRAGQPIELEVKRKDGKTETVEAILGEFPDDIPETLPKESSKGKALVAPKPVGPKPPAKGGPKKAPPKKAAKKDDKEKPKTGLQKIEGVGAAQRKFWVFIPDTYDPNVAHGLIVWLHPAGRQGRDADDMVKIWEVVLRAVQLHHDRPNRRPEDRLGGGRSRCRHE